MTLVFFNIQVPWKANFESKIKQHNNKVLRDGTQEIIDCKCRKFDCPLDGKCGQKNVIYQAIVEPGPQNKLSKKENKIKQINKGVIWKPRSIEKYIGKTSSTFKERWNFTNSQIRDRHLPSTALSSYIRQLKDNGYHNFKIKWMLLSKANPYTSATKICNLCNKEKYYLIYRRDTYTLNKQEELIRKCRHRRSHLFCQAGTKISNN